MLIGFFGGIFLTNIYSSIRGPSLKDSQFVKTCGELNGKEFNFEVVKTLHGFCFISCGQGCITTKPCNKSHIESYSQRKPVKFDVSQKTLDNSWRCQISVFESKIKAVPYFAYD